MSYLIKIAVTPPQNIQILQNGHKNIQSMVFYERIHHIINWKREKRINLFYSFRFRS